MANNGFEPEKEAAYVDGLTAVSPFADFIFSLLWIALGGLLLFASWQMDRMESQGSSLYTAPGSYPGLLAGLLIILGLLLAARAYLSGGHRLWQLDLKISAQAKTSLLRVSFFLLFALVYCLVLVGRSGIPFWLATFLFVTTFVFLFNWHTLGDTTKKYRALLVALSMGAGTSFLVSYIFQELFLVRLP